MRKINLIKLNYRVNIQQKAGKKTIEITKTWYGSYLSEQDSNGPGTNDLSTNLGRHC